MSSDCCAVYELPRVQRITGNTIRPGGLALTKRALAMAALPAASTVLDVGCGTGATVAYLSRLGMRAVGLDASAALLGQAEASGGLSQGRAEHLPFPAGRFDGLFAECCLSLMDDAALAADEDWASAEGLVQSREQQFEDWLALGIFTVLLSGADALVSSHLQDFPQVSAAPVGATGRMEVRVTLPLGGRAR